MKDPQKFCKENADYEGEDSSEEEEDEDYDEDEKCSCRWEDEKMLLPTRQEALLEEE